MDHFTQDYKNARWRTSQATPSRSSCTQAIYGSTASNTHTELSADFSNETTDASTHLTSPTIVTSQLTPQKQQQEPSAMTTYYQYDQYGNFLSASLDDPLAQTVRNGPDCLGYAQAGDVVGAYLSQQEVVYPVPVLLDRPHIQSWPAQRPKNRPEAHGGMCNAYTGYHAPGNSDLYHAHKDRYPDHAGSFGSAGFVSQSNRLYPYPNPETIRHLHIMHSLLLHLQPERKLKAVEGMAVNIVEEETGTSLLMKFRRRCLCFSSVETSSTDSWSPLGARTFQTGAWFRMRSSCVSRVVMEASLRSGSCSRGCQEPAAMIRWAV